MATDIRYGLFHDQLVLLDLSAVFDTVGTSILFDILAGDFGIDGTILQLLESYLCGRKQQKEHFNSHACV